MGFAPRALLRATRASLSRTGSYSMPSTLHPGSSVLVLRSRRPRPRPIQAVFSRTRSFGLRSARPGGSFALVLRNEAAITRRRAERRLRDRLVADRAARRAAAAAAKPVCEGLKGEDGFGVPALVEGAVAMRTRGFASRRPSFVGKGRKGAGGAKGGKGKRGKKGLNKGPKKGPKK